MSTPFYDMMPGPEHRDKLNQMWSVWQDAIANAVGPKGWSPILTSTVSGNRALIQVIDWTGGQGAKPTLTGFLGATGLVPNAAQAIDFRGPQGLQGIQGVKGDKGDQGEQGIQGVRGEKGDKGDRGEKGDAGDQGIQGLKGDQGEKGDKGDQGEQGIQGEKGDKGDKGDIGPGSNQTLSFSNDTLTISGGNSVSILTPKEIKYLEVIDQGPYVAPIPPRNGSCIIRPMQIGNSLVTIPIDTSFKDNSYLEFYIFVTPSPYRAIRFQYSLNNYKDFPSGGARMFKITKISLNGGQVWFLPIHAVNAEEV